LNMKPDEFKRWIKGKRTAIIGVGKSNIPLAKFLLSIGAVDITLFDKSDGEKLKPALENFKGMDLKMKLGGDYLKHLHGFDVIFKTPGIRCDIPELVAERERGAVVTSEMEVFFDLCPAEIFAVTGSDGKTTTTTLIYKILKEHGYRCWLGGNIGTPLLDKIEEIGETDKVVLELSSFQLHTMRKSPHTAVVTNISPNHLDVHKSMEEYIEAKKNIFLHQKDGDRLILNFDNEITREFLNEAKSRVLPFSRRNSLAEGAFLKNGKIVFSDSDRTSDIIGIDEIILPGSHNIENYLAATAAVFDYVEPESIRRVAKTFKGVEHRIEYVAEINGVSFYNDSIGTSPTRTAASIGAFKQKVILIAGGYDKQIPYDAMGEIVAEKVKALVLTGPTGPKIKKALEDAIENKGVGKDVKVITCERFDDTVREAYNNAEKGDIVLLSPASASFDRFKDFEERGNRFKELVKNLKAITEALD